MAVSKIYAKKDDNMALYFIFGGSSVDKSGWLRKKITKEAAVNKDKRFFIVVPEQFTMENQRKYVEESPDKCIFNIDILSFLRLSVRVFEEAGNSMEVLDDLGKTLVLRKVMEDEKDGLGYLKRGLTKPGVLDEIKSFLSELMQYDIHGDELEDMIISCEKSGKTILSHKLKDMKVIYEKFLEKIERNYLTTEGMYDVLEQILNDALGKEDQLSWLKESVICLDGYTGFTPIQYKVIKKLLAISKDVYLSVDIDRKGYENKDSRLFSLAHDTIKKMTKIATEAGVEIANPIWPEDKRIISRELLQLENRIFRYPPVPFKESTRDIRVIRAKNPEKELMCTVSHIKKLVQSEKYSYGDIAVVTGDLEDYGLKLKKMFLNQGIPCFLDRKNSIMDYPFIGYLRSFIDLFAENFSEDAVLAFIKNPYFCFGNAEDEQDNKDILENYIRKAGIKSFSQWKRPFTRKLKGCDEERLSGIRKKFYEKMYFYAEKMKKAKTVEDYTRCIYDFIVEERCYEKLLMEKEEAKKRDNLREDLEFEQIYGIVLEILDRLLEVLGNEKISRKEYAELFETGLGGGKIGLIPPQMNVVVIGDLERTRISDVKVMFILGMNDGLIPKPDDGGGILTELEREFMLSEGKKGKKPYSLAPTGKDNALIAGYYLYLNLTKPEEKLYISYSEINSKGEKRNPSYVLGKLRLIFPGLSQEDWENYKGTEDYDILPDWGREHLLNGIREYDCSMEVEEGSGFYRVLGWNKIKNEKWLDRLISSIGKKQLTGKIDREAAGLLYGERLFPSVTRLENYAKCAFRHFLSYGLGLREREIFKVQGPDFGNLFHQVMKEFFSGGGLEEVFTENKSYSLTKKQEERLFKAISTVIAGSQDVNEAFMEKERSRYIFKRLERMCKRSIWAVCIQLQKGKFMVKESELAFDKAGTEALRGIIDRLDIYETEDKIYFRIVDYKTGKEVMNPDEIYYGLKQQLFVYMEAAEKYLEKYNKNKEAVPAGAYYYNVSDPVLSEDSENPGNEGEGDREAYIRSKMLSELRMEGYTNSEAPIPEYTDRDLREEPGDDSVKASDIVHLKYKKDGSIDRHSKTMDTELFRGMKEHVKKKIKEDVREIYSGNVEMESVHMAGEEACKYCPYGEICLSGNIKEKELEPIGIVEIEKLIKKKDKS